MKGNGLMICSMDKEMKNGVMGVIMKENISKENGTTKVNTSG